MAMGPGRFLNVMARLNVELGRMRRIGIPDKVIDDIKQQLMQHKPADEPAPAEVNTRTTPYALAVNRLEGYKAGKYTWQYFIEQWELCSEDDQLRLNELTKE